ncbi:hypothetical protein WMY93_000491 [Mugilogobius chulae]|uniref:TOG domain-containing protein n=1 Tax=Mugilogobius chulae TaxID=88201 RepID=A0AAW0Q7P3_9GOBI
METNDDDDEASVPSRRSGPSHRRRPHFLPKKIPLACPDESAFGPSHKRHPHFLPKKIPLACPDEIDDDLPEPSKPSGRPPRQENCRPLKHRAPESYPNDQQNNMESCDDDDEVPVPSRSSGPTPKYKNRRPKYQQDTMETCDDEVEDVTPKTKPPKNPATENRKRRADAMERLKDRHQDKGPYKDPEETLEQVLKDLELSDVDFWDKKVRTLDILQTLVMFNRPHVEQRIRVITVALIDQVSSKRTSLACAAVETLAMLAVYLKTKMDTEVGVMIEALLKRLGTGKEIYLKEKTNMALECISRNCSLSCNITALLDCGHGNKSDVIRTCTAEQLAYLVEMYGTDKMFDIMKFSSERIVVALSEMAVDRNPEVRHEGKQVMKTFVDHPEFKLIWNAKVPTKNKSWMRKFLKD